MMSYKWHHLFSCHHVFDVAPGHFMVRRTFLQRASFRSGVLTQVCPGPLHPISSEQILSKSRILDDNYKDFRRDSIVSTLGSESELWSITSAIILKKMNILRKDASWNQVVWSLVVSDIIPDDLWCFYKSPSMSWFISRTLFLLFMISHWCFEFSSEESASHHLSSAGWEPQVLDSDNCDFNAGFSFAKYSLPNGPQPRFHQNLEISTNSWFPTANVLTCYGLL